MDYVARLDRGTVQIKVYLQTGVNLTGEGDQTVLIKEPSAVTRLKLDSDWYYHEITLLPRGGSRVLKGEGCQDKPSDGHQAHAGGGVSGTR